MSDKATSINFQPLKSSSEIHNLRHKELDYIRKDLTHLNESWFDPRYEGKSIAEIRQDITERYKATVGQKPQSRMVMFREGVVVIDDCTTMEQLKKLAVALEKEFGIKTMQIHIHRDEGYRNTDEWKPNLHAHMVCDWTQPNGKSLKLNDAQMSQMQTINAEVLGMRRGESSDRKHLNAVQYKNKKEGERLLALQQQNEELQSKIEHYQQDNEQLRNENDELQQRAEEIREAVDSLKSEVRKLKITKAGKQAFLLGLNKITDKLGKSDLLIENEERQAKIEEAEANLAVWQGKYDKLKADLDRRTAERDAARKEKNDLESALAQKDKEISNLESSLIKSRKETLRLGRIAEPWNHALPDVVKIDRCDTMRTPGGHALRLHLEGGDYKLIKVSYAHHEMYRKGELSLEHLIAIYATHDIDVAIARKLDSMSGKDFQSALAKLANTMFHALPAILYPALGVHVSVSHGTNGYVNVRHKSREDILRELPEQGYSVGY